MPDGGVPKFTFKIPPGGLKKECEFKDGRIGVTVKFADRYLYEDRRMPLPYIFQAGAFVIPAEIGESMNFTSPGEFWHKGMVVDTPNCEHISLFIDEFVQKVNGGFLAVGVLGDCTFRHQQFIKRHNGELEDPELTPKEKYQLLYTKTWSQYDRLLQYVDTLEQTLESAREQGGKTVKKKVDEVLSMVRDLVHDITATKEPFYKRIFNFGFLAKVIIIGIALWAFLHFGLQVI